MLKRLMKAWSAVSCWAKDTRRQAKSEYCFVKSLVEAGVPVMERRCWEVLQVRNPITDEEERIAFGCGAVIRFLLGSPITCPFCGQTFVYKKLEPGKTFFDVYPVTPDYTDSPAPPTEAMMVLKNRALKHFEYQVQMRNQPQQPHSN